MLFEEGGEPVNNSAIDPTSAAILVRLVFRGNSQCGRNLCENEIGKERSLFLRSFPYFVVPGCHMKDL
jgi:hypothetical protein